MSKLLDGRLLLRRFWMILALSVAGLFVASPAFATDPVIYPVAASAGVTVAYVAWTTDIASNSRVDYGTTTAYGFSVTDGTSVTYHLLTLSGLAPGSTYHFRVTSGASQSADYTFTTYANPTGTVRTVGPGKTYSTVQACASAAAAGDTCLVYAGTYNETVTPSRSGIAGSPITFLAQEAAAVYGFDMSSRTYISIKGFEITHPSGNGITGASSHNAMIENNYIHSPGGRCIFIPENGPSNDVVIRKNIIYHCGWGNGGSGAEAIYAFGDRLLIDGNDQSHSADFTWAGGTNVVIRNNTWHHASHDELPGSSEHIDGYQLSGYALSYSLLEGNREYICMDTTGNCHFVIMRNQGATCDTIILRYNSNHETQSDLLLGGVSDTVLNTRVYNNTFGYQTVPDNWGVVWGAGSDGGKIVNNIFYNNVTPGYYVYYDNARVVLGSNNLVFNAGYSGSWNALYSSEPTYGVLRNRDPLFVNYPLDISLQSGSPAIDAGGPLTAVGADDSGGGTALIVNDAKFFQPGWAGTNADWIAVGTVANVAQISAINYGNNTITLANAIPRKPGDSVWLYKKSDGVRVLYGAAPEIGAYEYTGTTATAPSAPRNLKIR